MRSMDSESPISLCQWESLWAELTGGEYSLHWKANMPHIFSIMTVWSRIIFAFFSFILSLVSLPALWNGKA